MLIEQTLGTLRRLKLNGMAKAFEQQHQDPNMHALSFEDRFSMIVDREAVNRENKRLSRLLRAAKLRQHACVEDINYKHKRGLERSQMVSLSTCDWIRAKQNLLLVGPTGTGKSYIACALGNAACRQGLSVFYIRATRLFEELKIAHGDGSFGKKLLQLTKVDLLILDDWGISPLDRTERQDLLEIIEERHGLKSTMITSQLPIEHWHSAYIQDATIGDAVLDRLLHSAHQIQLKGESMRKNNRLPNT
jgi:DNA replication protein DnaC